MTIIEDGLENSPNKGRGSRMAQLFELYQDNVLMIEARLIDAMNRGDLQRFDRLFHRDKTVLNNLSKHDFDLFSRLIGNECHRLKEALKQANTDDEVIDLSFEYDGFISLKQRLNHGP